MACYRRRGCLPWVNLNRWSRWPNGIGVHSFFRPARICSGVRKTTGDRSCADQTVRCNHTFSTAGHSSLTDGLGRPSPTGGRWFMLVTNGGIRPWHPFTSDTHRPVNLQPVINTVRHSEAVCRFKPAGGIISRRKAVNFNQIVNVLFGTGDNCSTDNCSTFSQFHALHNGQFDSESRSLIDG